MPQEPDYKALYEAEQTRNRELQAENERLSQDNASLSRRLRAAADQLGPLQERLKQMGQAAQEIERLMAEAAAEGKSDPTKPGGS